MKDYIDSIGRDENIPDAYRSEGAIQSEKDRKNFWISHILVFLAAVFVSGALGLGGFLGTYMVALAFAAGLDAAK